MPKNTIRHQPFRGLRPPPKPAKSRPETFAAAMEREGTRPLGKAPGRVPPARASRPRAPAPSAPAFLLERDEEWLSGARPKLAPKTLERLRGTPKETLDLHRHDSETARRRVASFLAKERARGRDLVLVIVGRGRHSPGGEGVLRHEIVEWLTTLPASAHVLAFRTAPRALGGTGAVLVLLAR